MGKRANGEGTISKRMRGGKVVGWRTAVTVGYDSQGRQLRHWISGKTQAEVQEGLRALQSELHRGTLSKQNGLTVTAYMEQWLEYKGGQGVKDNTLRSYRDSVRLYIKPYLGEKKVEKLRPLDVEHMMTKLRQAGKSPALSSYALRVLKMALRQAVLWQIVARNVAEAVRPPLRQQPDLGVWTAGQATTFLQVTESHRLHAAFYLALMTGMRRGEILGLKWEDLHWSTGRLTVKNNLVEVRREGEIGKFHAGKPTVSSVKIILQTPKTKASRREITLSKGTLSRLQAHLDRQKQEQNVLGDAWQHEDFVFANEFGGPTEPRTLYGWFTQLTREAGLPKIRFHDLRHTAASLMFQRRLNVKTISDRLGHTDEAFTMRTYIHMDDEQRQEAAFDIEDFTPTEISPAAPGSDDSEVAVQDDASRIESPDQS